MTTPARLCEHALQLFGSQLTPRELSTPWTYVHRRISLDGERYTAELIGVLIYRDDGSLLPISVASMVGV